MATRVQRFIIHGRFPGLNEYQCACRANKFSGAKMKREGKYWTMANLKVGRVKPVSGPVKLTFTFYEKDRRRDWDNVESFAKKCILDGMQEAGVLPNDNWRYIVGSTTYFKLDKLDPRIEVVMEEVEVGADED